MIRVLIQGAGAVGSYLGARLALAGAEVAFVARGRHLEAMRGGGLQLTGPRGDAALEAPLALASVRELPWVPDVSFLAVKTYDVPGAAADLADAVVGGSVVVTLQNGVAGTAPVLEALPVAVRDRARVVAGLASVSAVIAAPGVIRYTSDMSSITAAPFPGGGDVEERLRAVMEAAGMPLRTVPDIRHALWRKFLSLATNAALTGLARSPAGSLYRSPDSIAVTRRAIAEVAEVARAEGVAITRDEEEAALAQLCSFPVGMYASMYHDLAAGKRLEAPWLSGTVARLAAKHGIDAPVHTTAWICLRPHAEPKEA